MTITTPTHPQVDPVTLGEHGGHVVYAMPMFLRVAAGDPLQTVEFFTPDGRRVAALASHEG